VALLAIFPQLFSSISFDWTNVICSYLFVLSPNSLGEIGTVTQTGWTLCFEAYFYAVFAILLALPRRWFLIMASAIFGAGLLMPVVGIPIAPWAIVAARPLVLEFYAGAIIGLLFLRGGHLPVGVSILAIVVGAGWIVAIPSADEWHHILFWGTGSVLILAGAVSLECYGVRVPKALIALGASSYSLYLVHPLILPPLGKVWARIGLSFLPPLIPGVTAFVIAVLIAHGVYLCIERPITDRLKAWSPATRPLRSIYG
jgi:exopolysaccharide production protein ExoZ